MTDESLTDAAGPQLPSERVERLDVLRGFAMFGVLLVNTFESATVEANAEGSVLGELVSIFGMSKFYPLLAFLFGLGFALQFARLSGGAGSAVVIYLRRSAALIIIGVIGYTALLTNPILLQYGSLGFPLLLFRRSVARSVMIGVLICASLSVLYSPVTSWVASRSADAQRSRAAAQARAPRVDPEEEAMRHGTYGQIVVARTAAVSDQLFSLKSHINGPTFQQFALFLLGLYIARRGTLTQPTVDRRFLGATLRFGALLGLLGTGLLLILSVRSVQASFQGWHLFLLRRFLTTFSGPALAFSYAAGVVLLFERSERWRGRFESLRFVGRMALTNFLLQFACISGLIWLQRAGIIDHTPPGYAVLFSAVVFALLSHFSRWWLSRWRFGPAEWLWRAMTYWTLPTMRVTATRVARNEV